MFLGSSSGFLHTLFPRLENSFHGFFPGQFLSNFQILDRHLREAFSPLPPTESAYNGLSLEAITAYVYLLVRYLINEFISVFVISSMRAGIICRRIPGPING